MSDDHHTAIVVGAGRSGTTYLLSLLADSNDGLVTVPRVAGRFPRLLGLSVVARRIGALPDSLARPSAESTGIFESAGLALRSMSTPRALEASDTHGVDVDLLRRRVNLMVRLGGGEVALIKSTAACHRIGLLSSIFNDCRFIYLRREPAAVVSSLLETDFWPTLRLWWCLRTPDERCRLTGQTMVQVATEHWYRQVEAAENALGRLSANRWCQIEYEALCDDPAGAVGPAATVLGVPLSVHASSTFSPRVPDPAVAREVDLELSRLRSEDRP